MPANVAVMIGPTPYDVYCIVGDECFASRGDGKCYAADEDKPSALCWEYRRSIGWKAQAMTPLERLRSLVEAGDVAFRTGDATQQQHNAAVRLARAMVSEEAVEKVARALWDRERIRSEVAGSIISGSGLAIEPFEQYADTTWRPDARAALEALAQLANPDQDTRGEP